MLVGRQVLEDDLDPAVARDAALEQAALALDLALDQQARAVAANAAKRAQHLGHGLALAEEAGGIEEAQALRIGLLRPREAQQLGVDAPVHARALDPHLRVALLLAGGQRVDDVEGALRGLDVAARELLPDEAPDGAHAGRRAAPRSPRSRSSGRRARGRARSRGPRRPARRSGSGTREASADPRLVPDPGAVDERGPDVAGPGRPREHERLVAERVERRAQLARDHALPAVEPVGADPDSHRREGRWVRARC